MKIRPRSRVQWLVGVLAHVPVAYGAGATTALVDAVRFVAGRPPLFGAEGWDYLGWVLALHVGASLAMLGSTVACLLHLASNTSIDDGLRMPVALLVVVAGPFAVPAYWWSEMVRPAPDRVRALRP